MFLFLWRSVVGAVSLLNGSSDLTVCFLWLTPPRHKNLLFPSQGSNLPKTDVGAEKKRQRISQAACPKTTTLFHPTPQIRVDAGEHTHTCPYPGCETRSRQDDFLYQYVVSLVPTRKICGSLILLAAAFFLMTSPMN